MHEKEERCKTVLDRTPEIKERYFLNVGFE